MKEINVFITAIVLLTVLLFVGCAEPMNCETKCSVTFHYANGQTKNFIGYCIKRDNKTGEWVARVKTDTAGIYREFRFKGKVTIEPVLDISEPVMVEEVITK